MNKNILIIERNPDTFRFYQDLLRREGYNVQTVSSDIMFLKYEFTTPDLFIINSRFLTLNATEMCHHLKINKDTMNIPVVIISNAQDIKNLAQHCGAAAFVETPIISSQFLAAVKSCLEPAS